MEHIDDDSYVGENKEYIIYICIYVYVYAYVVYRSELNRQSDQE
jgi:hypothetical protein